MLASEWLVWQSLVLVVLAAICWVRVWIRPVPEDWDRWILVGALLTLLAMASFFLGQYLEPGYGEA